MRGRWNVFRFPLHKLLWVFLILQLQSHKCLSLNPEGLALLEFRSKVDVDPHRAFKNWNHEDSNPCSWSGVHCIDGKVETLNLKGLSLGGILAPDLGKLRHLRSLVLYQNNFSGVIPKEIGQLTMLELLDLRGNKLSGKIPTEIGDMISLKHILLCDDKFQSNTPLMEKLNRLSELKCDQNLSFTMVTDSGCMNRKVKHCVQQSGLQQLKNAFLFLIPIKGKVLHFLDMLPWFEYKMFFTSHGHGEKHGVSFQSFPNPYVEQNVQHTVDSARRKLLQESNNLAAVPISGSPPQEAASVPSIGSGSFPAVPNSSSAQPAVSSPPKPDVPNNTESPPLSVDNESTSGGKLGKRLILLVLPAATVLVTLIAGMIMWRKQGPSPITPWTTGLSGPLQKAFVAGVPKLNRSELEAACEDFSNIIRYFPSCTVFKGTLSSGTEVAVVSTTVESKDWSKRSQAHFRKKVDTLSRTNHKNFANLLGYCEENEPFTRMMVYEYAPNATLFEHLHVKEYEHLDWSARMRIIMGTAYCLQYMHHELNPPFTINALESKSVYLTDDYAAKVCDRNMWMEFSERRNKSIDEDMDPSDSSFVDPGSNVYSFGILMLEIISGKLPYSEEDGSILNWAIEYLNDKRNFKNLVDPALKSCKNNELEVVCDAIQECIHGDPKHRPKIKEITAKLRDGLGISAEAAIPRLSPLWWAELEILSVEAS